MITQTDRIPTLSEWLGKQPKPSPRWEGKLTAAQRREVRIRASHGATRQDLAVKYNVSVSTIYRIINY